MLAILFATSLHAQPALFEPSLSPDAKIVAFVSGGDIWTAPVSGGEARLLVAHPAYDSRPLFSPDGKSLAFISTRSGNGDIYVVDLATSQTRRITAPVRPQVFLRRNEELIVSCNDLPVRIGARFAAREEIVASHDRGYCARNDEPPR